VSVRLSTRTLQAACSGVCNLEHRVPSRFCTFARYAFNGEKLLVVRSGASLHVPSDFVMLVMGIGLGIALSASSAWSSAPRAAAEVDFKNTSAGGAVVLRA
jgi:hypothetical protein